MPEKTKTLNENANESLKRHRSPSRPHSFTASDLLISQMKILTC